MKLPRRQFLHLAAGAAVLPIVSRIAWAQAYPSRPVRLIVPIAPAGATDIVGRLIGQWLSERLGQQFVIENRPGAGTTIGTEVVVRAPADGYTLLLVSSDSAISATLYEKLSFNFIRDIAPVAGIVRLPFLMLVNPSVPAKTVPEFIAYAKANPGKINIASPGPAPHLAGELFKTMAGLNLVHVPYRGGAPALTDLISGQVQVMFLSPAASIEYIRSGRLRALAVASATRSEVLPDIPTVGEFYQATRRAPGSASACRRTRPPNRRQAQQGDQCRPRRSQDKGAICRPRQHSASRIARRLRQVHRRRNREVGQGYPGGQHQGRVNAGYSINPVQRMQPATASGQTRSLGDVGSMSGLPESGHGCAIYEYTL